LGGGFHRNPFTKYFLHSLIKRNAPFSGMKKQRTLGAKSAPPNGGIKPWVPIFRDDLDGQDFDKFSHYKKLAVEYEKNKNQKNARALTSKKLSELESTIGVINNVLSREPDTLEKYKQLKDPKVIRDIAKKMIAEGKMAKKKAIKEHAANVSALLKKFEAIDFDGPDDWIYKKEFKDNLREALLEFISGEAAGRHWFEDKLMIPADYRLSGQQIGSREVHQPFDVVAVLSVALFWKARRILGLLWVLSENKDPKILGQIAQIIIPFIKEINNKAIENSKVLGFWPRTLPTWPVLKSLHPDFDGDHKAILKLLKVGEKFPFPIGEEARWKASDTIGKWALHLCQEIEIMQEGHYVDEKSDDWEQKLLTLERFSGENWQIWWEIAQGLLQKEYVDVVNIKELAATVKSKEDLKYPSRVRRRILQALRSKFKSMARVNKA